MTSQHKTLQHDDARDDSARSDTADRKQARHALPHEQDQSHQSQTAQTGQHAMKQAYADLAEGQVDTEARGTGGVDEANKALGKRGSEAPKKNQGGMPR